VGSNPVVHSCHSLGLTDTPTIAVLIAAALLLLPDVTKISFGGIVAIERVVKEQGRRTEEAIQRLTMISQQQVHVHQHVYLDRGEAVATADRFATGAKEETFFQ
jgi:hypothetical protein